MNESYCHVVWNREHWFVKFLLTTILLTVIKRCSLFVAHTIVNEIRSPTHATFYQQMRFSRGEKDERRERGGGGGGRIAPYWTPAALERFPLWLRLNLPVLYDFYEKHANMKFWAPLQRKTACKCKNRWISVRRAIAILASNLADISPRHYLCVWWLNL